MYGAKGKTYASSATQAPHLHTVATMSRLPALGRLPAWRLVPDVQPITCLKILCIKHAGRQQPILWASPAWTAMECKPAASVHRNPWLESCRRPGVSCRPNLWELCSHLMPVHQLLSKQAAAHPRRAQEASNISSRSNPGRVQERRTPQRKGPPPQHGPCCSTTTACPPSSAGLHGRQTVRRHSLPPDRRPERDLMPGSEPGAGRQQRVPHWLGTCRCSSLTERGGWRVS